MSNFHIGAIINDFGLSDHDAQFVYFIIVPSSHPYYRGYDILEDGCLLVKWEPISEYDRNGQILYYTITYVPNCYGRQDNGNEENVTVSGSSNNVTLCNLQPGWEYRLGLSASTAKGMGPTGYHDDVFAGKKCVNFRLILPHHCLSMYKMFCKTKPLRHSPRVSLCSSFIFRSIPARCHIKLN